MAAPSIPRMELGAELGRGAHGVVFRGTRDGKSYAVKLPLHTGSESERDIAFRRFLREATSLARVRTPALPEVMEIGRSGGVPYLVMELATGETLASRLARGPLDEAQVLSLACQLATALEAIHRAGLVHRDVKPGNIVFDPNSGGVRLVDLGSAALANHGADAMATRAYAAPEVLSRDPRMADARADLYSLGCVLLECVGQRSLAPELRAAAAVAANVSEPLREVLARLLAVDPSYRFGSAGQLRGAVERILASPSSPIEESPAPEGGFASGTRLHGRGAELDRLRRAWADAQRGGGRTLLLHGPAGSGKTRLARAFVDDSIAAGACVLVAGCHPRDPRAFSAVRQLIEGYFRQCERLPAGERAQAFAEVRRIAGDLGPLLKLLSPLVARIFQEGAGVAPSENAEQAYAEGLAEFLERLLTEAGPAVVFVDDVQWLDPSSRRVLSRAANHAATARSLFLFGARGDATGVEVSRLTEVITAPMARIDLPRLRDDDIVALARDYLATGDLELEVRQALLRLSDGMPLRALEVLRTLVDEGVLLPHWGRWQLDVDALTQTAFPNETTSLLRRRIDALDLTTRSMLAVGAVIGMIFEDSLLATSAGVDGSVLATSLAEARRAEVIEPAGPSSHRFIHHSVRDALLAGCDDRALEDLHQHVAEALDAQGVRSASANLRFEIEHSSHSVGHVPAAVDFDHLDSSDADPTYRLAFHYSSGVPGRTPTRAAEVGVEAGRAAHARFDNERAIGFFEAAETALSHARRALDPQVRLLLAEARLRVGALDAAVQEFERVLADTSQPLTQARALERIAFVADMQLDSKRAWEALERAFGLLGEELPRETPRYAVGSARAWLLRQAPRLGKRKRGADHASRAHDEQLCALYYQAGRVAFSTVNPARIALAALRALEPAERLGESSALARAYLAYAFVLTVLGFPAAGARYLALGEDIGRRLRDPVVYSHALQLHMVIAAWGGRVQDSLDAASRCVLQYGHWRELNDFSMICYTQFMFESMRGRDLEAWKALDRAVDRISRHDGAPVIPEYLLLTARAALVGLGREGDARTVLHRLARATVPVPKNSATYASTFGSRVRAHTEKMELGAEFEELVAEFRALALNPKTVHLVVLEYFIHVASARVHTCLRATPAGLTALLPELARAHGDLKAAARRIALFLAHAQAVEGYLHLFHGRLEEARKVFEDAERLGVAETAPWVLYSVYRGRAHLLKAEGRLDAARDQAVLAESVATEHGAVYRARWVREEFGLRARRTAEASSASASLTDPSLSSDETASIVPGGSRARRQLRALLRISQARAHELDPDHQARVVVDEIVHALRAERGFLFLMASVAHPAGVLNGASDALQFVTGRDAAGRDLGDVADYDQTSLGAALAFEQNGDERDPLPSTTGTTARLATLAAPLVVDDVTAGVLYLDRPLAEGVFTDVDGEVLAALAGQVSLALELARDLRARELAQEGQLHEQKMEAVKRLAGGIAHDVNNMINVIRWSADMLSESPLVTQGMSEDVEQIRSAEKRAAELIAQLLAFSKGEFGKPELVRLGARVERLLPILDGLLGTGITLEARIAATSSWVLVDPLQFDQVLVNLVVNAMDAMRPGEGGKITIESTEVVLDEAYASERRRVQPGPHVRLTVSDTGCGMTPEIQQKIFEPYFTTKTERDGTGMGLAHVYGLVTSSGGHIDVTSAPGEGTTFVMHFPSGDRLAGSEAARTTGKPSSSREAPISAGIVPAPRQG